METPSAEQQLAFLTNLQRLMAEGQFTATYKYALLLALADVAVETGDAGGASPEIRTAQLAEKFIQFYWRQAVPFVTPHTFDVHVLRQNTSRQAEIVRLLQAVRRQHGDSLQAVQHDAREWPKLVNAVDQVIRKMPLWKLQTVGPAIIDFLYPNSGRGRTILLRPGVAYCLRQFHPLISELVRSAWIQYVRRHNHQALGTTTDLSEFLFGSERSDLSVVHGILSGLQAGRCFYCERRLAPRPGHVDHFVPWSKHRCDLGHNFVLAHEACNTAKSDHLAAAAYVTAWIDRNVRNRSELAAAFDEKGVLHDLPATAGIVSWAYQQALDTGGLVWVGGQELQPLQPAARGLLRELAVLRSVVP